MTERIEMAAKLLFPNEEEWKILSKFLAGAEGVIIIPPDALKKLCPEQQDAQDFIDFVQYEIAAYDFGGEADVLVDIAYPGSLSYEDILEPLKKGELELL